MSVPESVERAAAEAEAVLDKMAAQAQAQQQQVPSPEATAAALLDATAPQPTAPASEDVWKQRYNTLRGKYDAEMAALREALATRDQELLSLREMVARLDERTRVVASEAARPAEADPEQLPFSDKDREELGDFDAVIGRKILSVLRERIGPLLEVISQMDRRLQQLEATDRVLSERSQALQAQNLIQALDQKMPAWRRINQMPEFMAWLNMMDPYSGRSRRELLTNAWMAGDADRVVQFFNGFDAEARISETARGAQASPPPVVPPSPAYNVGAFAAPRTAPAAAPASAPAMRTPLSDSAIRTLFDPKRKLSQQQERDLIGKVLSTMQG